MNNYCAVLIDTTSIQEYIFASNQLKENLGASYLVDEIYKSYLEEAYKKVFDKSLDLKTWKKDFNAPISKEQAIGYIGGGNALLFFESKEKAKEFIKAWTRILLEETPGITTAVAYQENFNFDDWENEFNKLHTKLSNNKQKYSQQTTFPRHGITAECARTGLSMEEWNSTGVESEHSYISKVSYKKIEESKKSKEGFQQKYLEESAYTFTDEIDNLGQKENIQNEIAIVHIDGNDIGKKFEIFKTLQEIRNFSTKLKEATEQSFQDLINTIIKDIENNNYDDDINVSSILPITPIVIGGDDVTFVCNGKLGIYFAKIFIEKFEKKTFDIIGEKLTACAGIVIVSTKFPFYKAYNMAEELCSIAKKKRKEKKSNLSNSWLDFQISYGGYIGSIEEIREKYYKITEKNKDKKNNLLMRPYRLELDYDKDECNQDNFYNLIENAKELKKKLPNSKIKELREVLTLGREYRENFLNFLKARNKEELPSFEYDNDLFENFKTIYFDMIEILEYYPSFEIEKEEKKGENN